MKVYLVNKETVVACENIEMAIQIYSRDIKTHCSGVKEVVSISRISCDQVLMKKEKSL